MYVISLSVYVYVFFDVSESIWYIELHPLCIFVAMDWFNQSLPAVSSKMGSGRTFQALG